MDEFHDAIGQHHNGQIVRNLLMIGLDLQAQREAKEYGPKKLVAALIRIHQPRQHPRHKGNSLHFGVVTHLDNLEIVAAERHGNSTANSNRHAHAHGQEQQERSQKRNEQISSRPLSRQENVVNPLRIVSSILRRDGCSRHAAEHGVGPVRGIVGVRSVPLVHLMGHAQITGDVALVHNLTFQHLRHKAVAEGQKQQHNAGCRGYFLPNVFHKLPSS